MRESDGPGSSPSSISQTTTTEPDAGAYPGPQSQLRATAPSAGRQWAIWAWALAVVISLALALWGLVLAGRAGVAVTVTVDGYTETVQSTRRDVAALLTDLGLRLRPEDRVTPAPETELSPGLHVVIVRARRGLVEADGTLYEVFAQATTIGEMLTAAGVALNGEDELYLEGRLVSLADPLPAPSSPAGPPRFAHSRSWGGREPAPVRLSVRRSVPVIVDDGTVPYTIFTTADTVGEALLREQITVYLGDRVQPGPGTPVSAGLRVHIERSIPVLVTADGRTTYTRTRGKTVGAALIDLGIVLAGSDRVIPPLNQPLVDNLSIRVVRVAQVTLVESTPIPYESIMVPDDNLEIDQQRLAQAGKDGEFRRRWQITYEDGVETARHLVDEWVAAEPVTRMVAYGRKIVLRTLQTEEGEFTYWRKIRMYATSYSPARAGTPVTAPWYGRTRIGLTLVKGIVAVDPKVIPLRSYVYVPGYGKAIAGDTGGGVKGKWIDMGYSDWDYISWHWWTDVYVLAPPPPEDKILWVLPNYPPPDFPRRRR